jgi:hypothetical protein
MTVTLLEVYTPAQIPACGRMIRATVSEGKTIEEFLSLVRLMQNRAMDPVISKLRLVFELDRSSARATANSDFPDSLANWGTFTSCTNGDDSM